MIELLLVQTITNLALAAVVIKLRRELWPMIAGAGSEDVGFWVRSSSVLLVETPLLKAAKTAIRIRWLFTEELHLIYRLRMYQEAMEPASRVFYKEWRAWMQGDDRYRCEVEKPRGLSRIYSKAIEVFCREVKKDKKKEVVILPSRWRKRRYKRWRKPRPRRERATLYDLVEKFENK
jgi:hypothetical protein